MSAYALDLATRKHDGSTHSSRRIAVARLLDRFYSIIKSHDLFLPPDAIAELKTLGKQLVILYNALSVAAASEKRKTWKFVPKFHLWVHLCEIQAELFNPRAFWTYSDEDLVGQLVEVAKSCHANTVGETSLYKYLLLHFGCS